MDDFRAPDAERKVSGLLTKCIKGKCRGPPGDTQRKHLLSCLLSLVVTCLSHRRAH